MFTGFCLFVVSLVGGVVLQKRVVADQGGDELAGLGPGNAWVRGFRERRDDEPTRLSALEAVSEAGSVRGIGGDR